MKEYQFGVFMYRVVNYMICSHKTQNNTHSIRQWDTCENEVTVMVFSGANADYWCSIHKATADQQDWTNNTVQVVHGL